MEIVPVFFLSSWLFLGSVCVGCVFVYFLFFVRHLNGFG